MSLMSYEKARNLRYFMKKKKVHCAVFFSSENWKDYNVAYFSRVSSGTNVFVVTPTRLLLFCSRHEELLVKSLCYKGISIVPIKKGKSLSDILSSVIPKKKRLAVNYLSISLYAAAMLRKNLKAKLVDFSKELSIIRQVKLPGEVAFISRSCQLASSIVGDAIKNISKAKSKNEVQTEVQLANFLKSKTESLGLELAFPPIVASGKNSASPHHKPADIRINGFCVIDFGVVYKNYCSDITRTIYVGVPDSFELAAYDAVLKAQEAGVKQLFSGNPAENVHRESVKALGKFSKHFIHKIGHSVGTYIHDPSKAVLEQGCRDKLQNSMIFTVEPGVYFKGKFGIRIEDTVLVSEKPKRLTTLPRELIIL